MSAFISFHLIADILNSETVRVPLTFDFELWICRKLGCGFLADEFEKALLNHWTFVVPGIGRVDAFEEIVEKLVTGS